MLPHGMIDSAAFRSLSTNAVALYVKILRLYNGFNNGDIGLGCRDAGKKINVGKGAASAALAELEERGFIKMTEDSGFNRKDRRARRWALTCHPLRDGIAPTNDWRFWKPQNSENSPITRTDSPPMETDEKNFELEIVAQSVNEDSFSLSEKDTVR